MKARLISILIFLTVGLHSYAVDDPGKRGKETIEGIDSDKNGVRDDIQVWIDKKYSENKKAKSALYEIAKTDPASCDFKYKVRCLEQIFDTQESLEVEIKFLEIYLNTEKRVKAYRGRIKPCVEARKNSYKCRF